MTNASPSMNGKFCSLSAGTIHSVRWSTKIRITIGPIQILALIIMEYSRSKPISTLVFIPILKWTILPNLARLKFLMLRPGVKFYFCAYIHWCKQYFCIQAKSIRTRIFVHVYERLWCECDYHTVRAMHLSGRRADSGQAPWWLGGQVQSEYLHSAASAAAARLGRLQRS